MHALKTFLCLPCLPALFIKDFWQDVEKDVNSQCQIWTGIWQLAMLPVLSLPLPPVWSPLVPTDHTNPSQWSSTWSSFPLWSAPEEMLLSQVYTAHGLVIKIAFASAVLLHRKLTCLLQYVHSIAWPKKWVIECLEGISHLKGFLPFDAMLCYWPCLHHTGGQTLLIAPAIKDFLLPRYGTYILQPYSSIARILFLLTLTNRHSVLKHPAGAAAGSYILVSVTMVRSFTHSRHCFLPTNTVCILKTTASNMQATSKHLNCFPKSPIHHTVEQLRQHTSASTLSSPWQLPICHLLFSRDNLFQCRALGWCLQLTIWPQDSYQGCTINWTQELVLCLILYYLRVTHIDQLCYAPSWNRTGCLSFVIQWQLQLLKHRYSIMHRLAHTQHIYTHIYTHACMHAHTDTHIRTLHTHTMCTIQASSIYGNSSLDLLLSVYKI